MSKTRFDEYGQPIIDPEEAESRACLLPMMWSVCDFQIGNEKGYCAFESPEYRPLANVQIQYLNREMRRNYGICALCWIPLGVAGLTQQLPEGHKEVRDRLGETTRGRYAVPMKAIRSLEALYLDQRNHPIPDCDYLRARYTSPGYHAFLLVWRNSNLGMQWSSGHEYTESEVRTYQTVILSRLQMEKT